MYQRGDVYVEGGTLLLPRTGSVGGANRHPAGSAFSWKMWPSFAPLTSRVLFTAARR